MINTRLRFLTLGLIAATLILAGCGSDGLPGADGRDGADGTDGPPGPQGPPGADAGNVIDASQVSDEFLASLDVEWEITDVTIASPPVVTFTLTTSTGVPIVGIVPFWEASSRFVRFNMCKLIPGDDGDPDTGDDPDTWVNYVRSTGGVPTYDTGASLVDNGDGSYVFTFETDVTNVPGILYEPNLTHRVAGQIGSGSVGLERQNPWMDFVPNGGPVATTRRIATMASCNECHKDLAFHGGGRFAVEYCVTCHNPDLAGGEGNFVFMIHRIHSQEHFGSAFTVLGTRGGTRPPADFSELTYPQDLRNCRKCHNGDDAATPDADNWKEVPHIEACDGCHDNFPDNHSGGVYENNRACELCHTPELIEGAHTTPNATPNNPGLILATHKPRWQGSTELDWVRDQRNISYELVSAAVDPASGNVTIVFKILDGTTPLDMTNLPADMDVGNSPTASTRWPSFILAYARSQNGITAPMDYNNRGREGGQPISVSLGNLVSGADGTMSYNASTGENTAVITDVGSHFPGDATLRAVGLQSYFYQDLSDNGVEDVSLHTPSAVIAVTGDAERRTVVDNENCAQCHEWLEMHGGSRTYNIQICTLCHNPNLSSSGRTTTDPPELDPNGTRTAKALADAILAGTLDASVDPADPLTWPEDSNFIKDLVHGIHSEDFRTRPFQFVRGPGREGYYDFSEITFPRGASTRDCRICHAEADDGRDWTYELPLPADLLGSTVRTTSVDDGLDALVADVQTASENVGNDSDWINTPVGGTCFMCHTSVDAMWHMIQNGALLSNPAVPIGSDYSNRRDFGTTYEACGVCHGPGRVADINVVHGISDD